MIRLLNNMDIYVQAYHDVIVILVKGDNKSSLIGLKKFALGLVEDW